MNNTKLIIWFITFWATLILSELSRYNHDPNAIIYGIMTIISLLFIVFKKVDK